MIGGYAHCNIFTAVACHLAVFYVTHRWVRGGAVVLLSTGLEDRDTFENRKHCISGFLQKDVQISRSFPFRQRTTLFKKEKGGTETLTHNNLVEHHVSNITKTRHALSKSCLHFYTVSFLFSLNQKLKCNNKVR